MGPTSKSKPRLTSDPVANPSKRHPKGLGSQTTEKARDTNSSPSSPESLHQFPSALDTDDDNDSALLAKLRGIVREELDVAAKRISTELFKEIKEIGHRTSSLETRMDDATIVLEGHETDIENLQEEIAALKDKLEDLENRSRRDNLRIRGLPESIIDLNGAVTALFQELAPTIPAERLEMDRVHRALSRKLPNGPPRDIFVKFHYHRVKDQLMRAASAKKDLTFQGHPYELYADLAQSTIFKRKTFKPYTQILQEREIRYRWGYPFKIIFTVRDKEYQPTSLESIRKCFKYLKFPLPQLGSQESECSEPSATPPSDQRSAPNVNLNLRSSQHLAMKRLQDQRYQQVPEG